VDDDLAALLKSNGCDTVFFGIESGDEGYRNAVLGKGVTDGEIRRGAAVLKRHGIRFRTYNIIGFPGETFDQALKTVALNVAIGTDYPWCSLFMPYPGTRLADYARQEGYLDAGIEPDHLEDSFHRTLLDNPDRDRLINLHKFFQTVVLFPSLLPLVARLVRLPVNRLFQLWFSLVYFLLYVRSERRGLLATLADGVRNSAQFLQGSTGVKR
jgi:hypothetical protein